MDDVENPQESAATRYTIDEAWFESKGRSLTTLIEARLCADARAHLGRVTETRTPVSDAAGRVAFEARRTTVGADVASLMDLIADECARLPEYRNPRLPLAEMLFRILLAKRNRPMTADELMQEAEAWLSPGDGRVINPAVIERVIAGDTYYGICPAAEE